jgi:membrane fusion protein, multidrug efflux system
MRGRVADIRSKRNGCGIKHSRVGRAAVRPCKLLLALAAAAAACATKDDPAARQRPAPLVAVAHPRVRDVEVAVRAPVDLRPLLTADIGSRTLGYLDAVLVDRGDRVKRGQVVALVRPSDLPDQLAAARAAAAQSRASAQLARANQERAALLAPSGRISRQELQQSEAALAAAEAQEASARAQVAALATRLGEMRITAPLDGVISARRLDPGALVGPSSGNTGPILTVDQVESLRCFVTVNERDALSVRLGQQARIDLDAAPGRPYLGKVVRIAPSLDPLTRTLEAEVQIPNGSGELRPGMYGRAAIVTAVHERAVTVPVQAVQISGGRRIAFVLQGDRVRRREVQIGVDGEDWLEIIQGLSPDEETVIAGIEGLADGAQVRPARNTEASGSLGSGDGADAGAPEARRPAIPVRD